MSKNVCGLIAGAAFGFVIAWAQLTDPAVIRRMLLLREFDVFLIMGSAIAVAAVGCRMLRAFRIVSFVSRERIEWQPVAPRPSHVFGSALFGAGWSVAGTCPAPVAAMIGQGRFGGLFVAGGIFFGIALHRVSQRLTVRATRAPEATVGL